MQQERRLENLESNWNHRFGAATDAGYGSGSAELLSSPRPNGTQNLHGAIHAYNRAASAGGYSSDMSPRRPLVTRPPSSIPSPRTQGVSAAAELSAHIDWAASPIRNISLDKAISEQNQVLAGLYSPISEPARLDDAFPRLKTLIVDLWGQLNVPGDVQQRFARYFESPQTVNKYSQLAAHCSSLFSCRTKIAEILESIREREEVLSRTKGQVEEVAIDADGQNIARLSSIIEELVSEWRAMLPWNTVFIWKGMRV